MKSNSEELMLWFNEKLNKTQKELTTKMDAVQNMFKNSEEATAAPIDILENKTAYNGTVLITGTMPDNGSWTKETDKGERITIPRGYHDGSGYVSSEGAYNAGKNEGTNAAKVGTAAAGDVLDGKTFTNSTNVGIEGTMEDRQAVTVDAAEVTHDDNYTYLKIPGKACYGTGSKVRALNSDIADNIPPDIIANHIRQILFKANTDPVNALYDGVGFAQSVDGCRVFINGTLAGEIFTNTQIRINFKKNDVITFARIGNSTVYFYYAYFFETSTK